MVTAKFDTFEDEAEVTKLIKKLQSYSLEYMNDIAPWELPQKEKKQLIKK